MKMFLYKAIFLQICKASQRVDAFSHSAAELESGEISTIESNSKTVKTGLCTFWNKQRRYFVQSVRFIPSADNLFQQL